MTTEEKIEKIRVWLLIQQPWFGQLSCYLLPEENNKIPTAAVDIKGHLYYNKKFLDGLTIEEGRAIFMHEVLHLALRHLARFTMDERDATIWNIAADLKVNEEISRISSVSLPKGCVIASNGTWKHENVLVKSVNEKTTEQIFYDIKKQIKKLPQNSPDDLIMGGGSSKSGKGDGKSGGNDGQTPDGFEEIEDAEAKRLASEWEGRVESACQSAEGSGQGHLPAGVVRELNRLNNPKIHWTSVLKQRYRKMGVKHTWKKPNKNRLPHYFQGRTKQKGIKLVCAVDTSGSMSKEDITNGISEIYGIMKAFPFLEMWVCDCDAEMYNAKKVTKHELSKLLFSGGGGTSFRPVFKWVKKELNDKIDALVFITDLYGDFPSEKPPYETFWVTETKNYDIPFGRKLVLKV